MEWVKHQNARTLKGKNIEQSDLYQNTLNALNNKHSIPYIKKIGYFWYNIWRDEQHIQGIWRRIPYVLLNDSRVDFSEYLKSNPSWEPVLDLDELGRDENVTWVFKGCDVLKPGEDKALVFLSPGGGDAIVVREFDLLSKSFVTPDQGGFYVSEAKTVARWRTEDSIFIGTTIEEDEKKGLTDSGYPRTAKVWTRGTSLSEAEIIFESNQEDMMVLCDRDTWTYSDGRKNIIDSIRVMKTIFTYQMYIIDNSSGELVRLLLPEDAQVNFYWDSILVRTRSSWKSSRTTYPPDSLLAAKLSDVIQKSKQFELQEELKLEEITDLFVPLFNPSMTTNLHLLGYIYTKDYVIIDALLHVKQRSIIWKYELQNRWKQVLEGNGTEGYDLVSFSPIDIKNTNEAFMYVQSFSKPIALYYMENIVRLEEKSRLKVEPSAFDAKGIETVQRWAISADGTRVPYFLVGKDLSMKNQKTRKTLLEGYGGFDMPEMPHYDKLLGIAWLEKGGVYALANIRGGGEFGTSWHLAAVKRNRLRAYEDFEAIADDLITTNITSPKQLGCMGASNGGLLVGNMLVREGSNDRFGAIVCNVPLLDMRRYNKLLAGASWMAEYGDPDKPEDWKWMKHFSPFHMIKRGATYPKALFTSSTLDDRVHPGHARKMVAKLKDYCDQETADNVWYYENREGGHGGAANSKQTAFMATLEYQFLWDNLEKVKPIASN